MIEIDYGPHRIKVTAVSTSPIEVRYYFVPLYGPDQMFEFEPMTLTPYDISPSREEP